MAVTGNTAPISATFKLTVRNTRGAGTSEYAFSTGMLTAGRDESCDIPLESERVSRTHASFSVRDGGLFVEDLGSANGTRVNDRKIDSARELVDGDVVRIGDFVITVSGGFLRPAVFMRLKGMSAGTRGMMVEFSRSPSLVGRGEDADVVIVHASISRRHCRVDRRSDGSVLVSDLESANGIGINGARITLSQVAQGDTLTIGNVDFMVELPGQPTCTTLPAVGGRGAAFVRFVRSRVFLWILVGLLAAVAISIAGWTLGSIRREAGQGSETLESEQVPE